jgi:hypothetical protein
VVEAREIAFRHDHPMLRANLDAAILEHNSRHNYITARDIFLNRNPHAEWGNIAVGVRVGREVDASFFWCWSRYILSKARREKDAVLNFAVEMPHSLAMNTLLHWFLRSDSDSLLVLDDDMEFTPDSFDRLRLTPGCDVATALMCCRRGAHGPLVLGPWDEVNNKPTRVPDEDIRGIVNVHYVGFGFTLIKRWVLEAIAAKAETEGHPTFVFDVKKAEDGRFSDDARFVGARMCVNTNVRVGHRFKAAVYWNKKDGCLDFSENDFGVSLFSEK